jgi:ethanolamine utilization protein EutA
MSTSAAAPSKIAVCVDGKVIDVTAVDVGARLVVLDEQRRIVRLEEAGRRFGAELGLKLELGAMLTDDNANALAARMADALFEAMQGGAPRAGGAELLRLDPLSFRGTRRRRQLLRRRVGIHLRRRGQGVRRYRSAACGAIARARRDWGPQLARPDARIRATVIGASQYTMQVSGSTIFVSPLETLPLRNVPVIAPALSRSARRRSIPPPLPRRSKARSSDSISATAKIRSRFSCRGAARRRSTGSTISAKASPTDWTAVLAHGHPIVLAGDGDVGGLIGIHYCEEMKVTNPIVSIDGLELKEFDYIDIGAILDTSGAVPVVIKSLIFPTSAGVGKDWQAGRATSPMTAETP